MTIPPERVVASAGLLPARSTDHIPVKPIESATRRDATLRSSRAGAQDAADQSMELDPRADVWDWERIETTRMKGMEFAELIDGLDDAHLEFTGPSSSALRHY